MTADLRYDVLVLSPTPTYPLDAGNRRRVFRVCSELKQLGARVHFVYYPFEWGSTAIPEHHIAMMRQQWHSFHLLPTDIPVQSPPAGNFHHIDEWWDARAFEPYLRWIFARSRFDAFIVNYPYFSRALEFATPGTLRVLDCHDKFSGRAEVLRALNLAPEYFYTDDAEERRALERADVIWAIKDEEATEFRKQTSRLVLTVPHFEDLNNLSARTRSAANSDVVFGLVGARNSINLRTIRIFLTEIYPHVQFSLAPARFVIGGGICDDLRDLDLPPNVALLGRFDEPTDFYSLIDVALIPMVASTGLKIKAIEAFSYGIPVVAHKHSTEGIEVSHEFHTCTTSRQVADACISIAFNPSLLPKLRLESETIARKLISKTRAAIKETFELATNRPAILMTVDERLVAKNSVYAVHVMESIDYLKHIAPVVLYFNSGLPGRYTLWADFFSHRASELKAVFSPAAARSMGLDLGFPFPLQYHIADLEQELCHPKYCYRWFESLDDLGRLTIPTALQSSSIVRADLIECFPEAGAKLELLKFLDNNPDVKALACYSIFWPSSISSSRPSFHVPFWNRNRHFTTPPDQQPVIGIIVDPDNPGSAESIVGTLRLLLSDAPHKIITIDVADSSNETRRLAGNTIPSCDWLKYVDDVASGRVAPAFVIDMSAGNPVFDILREFLERSNSLLVKAAAQRGTTTGMARTTELEPSSLGALVDLLAALIGGYKPDPSPDRHVKFSNDAGWQLVWREIRMSCAF